MKSRLLCVAVLLSQTLWATVSLSGFRGEFGNNFYQLAAAIALAKENNCPIALPDYHDRNLSYLKTAEVIEYYDTVYRRIAEMMPLSWAQPPYGRSYHAYYHEYCPIPYEPGIEIQGYFQNEKYFKSQASLIRQLFAPSQAIENYLDEKFTDILSHPKTVGIHVRTAYKDWLNWLNLDKDPNLFYSHFWLAPDLDFYRRAIELFDEDSLFIVCSDHPGWCEKNFKDLNRRFVFIKDEQFIHDFFLLTKCKDLIIMASTFGWWAAYLNENPEARIVYRDPFLTPCFGDNNVHYRMEEWIRIDMPPDMYPPAPIFE